MSNVKLEETKDKRRLHIGSYFVDLNESEFKELKNIFGNKPIIQQDRPKRDMGVVYPSRSDFRAANKNCFGQYLDGKIAGMEWYEEKIKQLNPNIEFINQDK